MNIEFNNSLFKSKNLKFSKVREFLMILKLHHVYNLWFWYREQLMYSSLAMWLLRNINQGRQPHLASIRSITQYTVYTKSIFVKHNAHCLFSHIYIILIHTPNVCTSIRQRLEITQNNRKGPYNYIGERYFYIHVFLPNATHINFFERCLAIDSVLYLLI